MKHTTHDDVVKRLRRAEGHLRRTIAMIEEGRPCPEVAQQLHAVCKAIEQAKRVFIHDHIDHCLEDGSRSDGGQRDLIAEFKQISKYL